MRRTRLVVPAVIAALVALGGLTAGLILAGDQTPPATHPVEADIVSVPKQENLALPGPAVSAPDTTPTPEPELEPPAIPVTVENENETELDDVPDLDPTVGPGPRTGPSAGAAGHPRALPRELSILGRTATGPAEPYYNRPRLPRRVLPKRPRAAQSKEQRMLAASPKDPNSPTATSLCSAPNQAER